MQHQQKGAVAAGHELSAGAMAEILREGGNAFDAVIAGAFMACVAEPVLASPGGGGFCMVFDAAIGKTRLYDFFAQTPHKKKPACELQFFPITADFGTATQEFHIGAGSTAAPGFAQGLHLLHKTHASLPMRQLAAPAVGAAHGGVRISDFQACLSAIISPILLASPGAVKVFAPGGSLPAAGNIIKNPGLGETIEALADEGEALFVHGEIGRAILVQSAEQGGHLGLDDLVNYQVEQRPPLIRRYKGMELFLNPPPSSGGTLIALALELLAHMPDNNKQDFACNIALALDLGDMARRGASQCFENARGDEALTVCLKQAAKHKAAIRGTTHLSVIDREGNAAALTLSNGEGNGYMLGKYGFMMNNMLGEEDINPAGFHQWKSNKRLSSMMAPSLLRHNDGRLSALGSGGSNRIRSALVQVVARLAAGQPLAEAICAPRLHMEHGHLDFEDMFDAAQRAKLQNSFPDNRPWKQQNMFFGGVHAVSREPEGALSAAGDPRRSGAGCVL